MNALTRSLPLVLLILSACSTGDVPRQTSFVPKGAVRVLPEYAVAYADLVQIGLVMAAVYYVSDPSAPNWEIIETRLPDNRVFYRLNKQYFSVGGDGEARYILTQRAEALAREQGMAGFQIARYEEAVDSRILLPRRTAFAEILLQPAARAE